MEQYVGLDVHSKQSVFVIEDEEGNVVARGEVATSRAGMERLRNENALLGKCGRCRFRAICGGSRSRAYAATGAVMASDPLCVYEPGPITEPLVTQV